MATRVVNGAEELEALAGREIGVSDWYPLTQDSIQRFADLTGDHQWIHVDVERARRESSFGGPIAHGFLTLSLLPMLLHQAVEVRGNFKNSVNYGFNRLRFTGPVPAGARVRLRATPQSVKRVEGAIEIAWGVVVEVEGREKPAIVAEWLGRMYFA